ncbi:hypothetical protein ATZ33_06815 [Enterococcus silesiacus]|uniref:Lactococcin 972 family bacteriocin n=1 Tax=Enterococcus silesiacus TaxID=332949 RepID=A0A0S3K9V2_9ENTE|nr:hypothetical protein [Enterococcus silesiacus]ALS01088.1 hypothetical protein ATZ33_06815 [Enterococcus silesiacus]OJG91681.1 hypothetical protein RV15_GL000348 [Enterococcus silesiacus]
MKKIYAILCVVGFSVLGVGLLGNSSEVDAAETETYSNVSTYGFTSRYASQWVSETRWVDLANPPQTIFVSRHVFQGGLSGNLSGSLNISHRPSGTGIGNVTYSGSISGYVSGWVW